MTEPKAIHALAAKYDLHRHNLHTTDIPGRGVRHDFRYFPELNQIWGHPAFWVIHRSDLVHAGIVPPLRLVLTVSFPHLGKMVVLESKTWPPFLHTPATASPKISVVSPEFIHHTFFQSYVSHDIFSFNLQGRRYLFVFHTEGFFKERESFYLLDPSDFTVYLGDY